MKAATTFSAFVGETRLARGPLAAAVEAAKRAGDTGAEVLVLDDRTGAPCDFDLRGTVEDALARLDVHPTYGKAPERPAAAPQAVALLARHWEWLAAQEGSPSATLRRLVEAASKDGVRAEKARREAARAAASRALVHVAGNLPGYEEVNRALWAGDGAALRELTATWPHDVRAHALELFDEASTG